MLERRGSWDRGFGGGGVITMNITVTLTCTFPLFLHAYDKVKQKTMNKL